MEVGDPVDDVPAEPGLPEPLLPVRGEGVPQPQGVGYGTVAGYVESGEITTGLRHIFVMVLLTLLAFLLIR